MTWLPTAAAPTDLQAVLNLQPETGAVLRDFLAVADEVNPTPLLDLCKLRMAQVLKCRARLHGADSAVLRELQNWSQSSKFTDAERATLDYLDQFMIAANQVTAAQRSALANALNVAEPSNFVYALYINEAFTRFLSFFDIDPEPVTQAIAANDFGEKSDREFIEWVEGEKAQTDPKLLAVYYAFNLATCKAHGVDEVTDEIVRLRSAEYHDCKFCQSVRRVVDMPDGVDDLMNEVRRYRSSTILSERHKVALEVLETLVVAPALVSEELQTRILEQFSPQQIVELLLKEMFWMSNKPMISLGTDPGAVSDNAYTPFEYDAKGNFVLLDR